MKKLLITFTTGMDPDFDTSLAIMRAMASGGADVIEVGVPFSDPMADGPVIQEASSRALLAGANLPRIFELCKAFRAQNSQTALVLMGYYNPIMVYGVERFAQHARLAGVNGVIIVDLPPEEDAETLKALEQNNLFIAPLIAPTTSDERLSRILSTKNENIPEAFVYIVSVAGVTGEKSAAIGDIASLVNRVKSHTNLPVVVGFGIKTPDQAAQIAEIADGVVIGSRLVSEVAQNIDNAASIPNIIGKAVKDFHQKLKAQ
jgi:tryptophan synthase alpha chain